MVDADDLEFTADLDSVEVIILLQQGKRELAVEI